MWMLPWLPFPLEISGLVIMGVSTLIWKIKFTWLYFIGLAMFTASLVLYHSWFVLVGFALVVDCAWQIDRQKRKKKDHDDTG